MREIELLLYSTLFPNGAQPRHGLFVEHRLRRLVASGHVRAEVVAPVPWFPRVLGRRFGGRYGTFARVPDEELRGDLRVFHPRYPVFPKVGWTLVPFSMAAFTLARVRRVQAAWRSPGIIDAHYFFPDGVAAVLLGQRLGVPVVITARGSDINLIPRYRFPRWLIRRAAHTAAGIATVSAALKETLVEMGVPGERIRVLRNGVDLKRFRPLDREAVRSDLGVKGEVIVSIGNLIEAKGHHLVVEALSRLPGTTLMIVGEGPMREELVRIAESNGVAERVRMVGAVPQEDLLHYYNAADVLVLASCREGMPNVLLESLACGTPVVASAVGGIPEVVADPAAGEMMKALSADAVVEAVTRLRGRGIDRTATRTYAERFRWEETTRGQMELFRQILEYRP